MSLINWDLCGYDLWDTDTDLVATDFEMEVKVKIINATEKVIDPERQCGYCNGTGFRNSIDESKKPKKCFVCMGTGLKRQGPEPTEPLANLSRKL